MQVSLEDFTDNWEERYWSKESAFEQGRASMAIALPRRNTEQLCFIFSPITLVFSLLFWSVGYGKPSLSCKLINYLFTLKVFFFSLGTVILVGAGPGGGGGGGKLGG